MLSNAVSVANSYISNWFPWRKAVDAVDLKLDTEYCCRVAEWYEEVASTPGDEDVEKIYAAFKAETRRQYEVMVASGVVIEPWLQDGQPYANSSAMREDVGRTNRLYIYLTKKGHGSEPVLYPHPMREQTDLSASGAVLLYNDLFRAVHDYFAHFIPDNSFSVTGEFNATYEHSRMYSEACYPILLSETVGQICWFYFGPHLRRKTGEFPKKGDPDYLPPTARPYSKQKVVAFPDDFVREYFQMFTSSEKG